MSDDYWAERAQARLAEQERDNRNVGYGREVERERVLSLIRPYLESENAFKKALAEELYDAVKGGVQ